MSSLEERRARVLLLKRELDEAREAYLRAVGEDRELLKKNYQELIFQRQRVHTLGKLRNIKMLHWKQRT